MGDASLQTPPKPESGLSAMKPGVTFLPGGLPVAFYATFEDVFE